MSTKSSIMYDEKSDIHVYREMMDDYYYISCGISEMKITDKHLIIELDKAYDKVHHIKCKHRMSWDCNEEHFYCVKCGKIIIEEPDAELKALMDVTK